MELAVLLVAIVATVLVVARLCEPIGVPAPLGLLAVGTIGSFLPFVPEVDLSPDLVLYGLLPPLLYSAALGTSLYDIHAWRRMIIGLSFGLVLFTALGVALVAYALLPIPFALAFALGAIVAPPDAVAATAVARRIGLPRRTTTILEGESLLNDATALVSLRTALAASGLAVAAGGRSPPSVNPLVVAGSFAWAVVGGIGFGFIVFVVVAQVRKRLNESVMDTTLSFLVPFVAFVPAERIGGSGVLAVVTAGLLLANRAPRLQSAASRLSERTNWAAITFILENAVFLLIGLRVSHIVRAVAHSELTVARTIAVAAAVLLTCLVLRPLYMFPFAWLLDRTVEHIPGRYSGIAVGSWAGMRGVVTLAAALTLPPQTPLRSTLVLIALVVTLGTLLIQGSTLPALARALEVRGPDPRADALQEAIVVQRAASRGLRAIEAGPAEEQEILALIRTQTTTRINRTWERLSRPGSEHRETPSEMYRRMRLEMIEAERHELLDIGRNRGVDHQVLTRVLKQLDAEEAALTYRQERATELRSAAVLRAPDAVAGNCPHLDTEPEGTVPLTPRGCGECLELGLTWVHLRMCTRCGHVGCCDSSVGRHARAHFHDTGHPVIRSLEPGEEWRWCYVDEVLG